MNDMLEVTGLCKQREGFSLGDITFSLPTGYIMGLVGANGAGKTTTIRLILNQLHRDSGQIRVFGLDPMADELTVKQQVGTVFDQSFLVDDWTVSQACQAVSLFYTAWDNKVFQDHLRRFRIDPRKKIKDLSRGMTVKLCMAMALSHDAKLLILDEPTSGLDPVARDELLDILRDYILDGKHSVLFSTHLTGDLEKVADYITYLRDGRVIYTGSKDEFMESFLVVRGGEDDFPAGARQKIIGLRRYPGGFEGLVHTEDSRSLGKALTLEPANIEQIMVAMGKEDREQ